MTTWFIEMTARGHRDQRLALAASWIARIKASDDRVRDHSVADRATPHSYRAELPTSARPLVQNPERSTT